MYGIFAANYLLFTKGRGRFDVGVRQFVFVEVSMEVQLFFSTTNATRTLPTQRMIKKERSWINIIRKEKRGRPKQERKKMQKN